MDMNNVFNGVNWQEVQPAAAGRETFTDGWAQVVIADSVGKENNQKSGFGLTLYLKGVSGENNGKTIDDFINVFHSTPKAQEIGQRQFSAYCHATGEFKPIDNHASNLRNRPFWVKIVNEDDSFTNDKGDVIKTTRSRVKDWDSNNGTKHGAGGNGQTATAAQTQAIPAKEAVAENTAHHSNQAEPVKAEWSSPPPGAGEEPKQANTGWGQAATGAAQANNGGGNKAPWNS